MTDLFAALATTWPAAEIARLGSWTLRRGAGGGNRVSAATLDGPTGDPAEPEAAMGARGQRPLFMIRPGETALDAALAASGYVLRDSTVFYTAPSAALAAPGGLTAIRCTAPLACMTGIWAEGGVGAPRLAVMARAPEPRCYLLARLGDRPAGCAFVARDGPVAMLHALEIAPAARRHGLAVRMTRAAADWAARQGVATLALAVTVRNAPARALYEGLGMAEAIGYHYRIAPEAAS